MPNTKTKPKLEAVRDYWNARPCNIRHSLKPVGSKEYFDEVEQRKYFVEPHIPRFAEFDDWAGKRVLEIGCGLGTETINFARAGAKVTAVDLSAKSLELAKERAKVFGFSKSITFKEADAEELSEAVKPEPYDLIFSFGVLHHTSNPEKAFDQFEKYAKPGTTLKLMLYHKYSWKVLWIILKYGKGKFWDWKKLVARYAEAQEGCPIANVYSKREMRKIAESRGFEVEEITAGHIFPYRISEYVKHEYVKEWYWAWMPESLFNWLQNRIGWHLCMSAGYIGRE